MYTGIKACWSNIFYCGVQTITLVLSHNPSLITYNQHHGETRLLELCWLVKHILLWCADKYLVLKECNIPGWLNIMRDSLSREDTQNQSKRTLSISVSCNVSTGRMYSGQSSVCYKMGYSVANVQFAFPRSDNICSRCFVSWNNIFANFYPPTCWSLKSLWSQQTSTWFWNLWVVDSHL